MRGRQLTLYPEVNVLTPEPDVVHHLAAVHAGVIPLQGTGEAEGAVCHSHTVRHGGIHPGGGGEKHVAL